jgi:hypothetical protein
LRAERGCASYAKQAEDEQLLKNCQRIKARAIQRCGQLLKEIEPKKGGDRKSAKYQGGMAPFDNAQGCR